ncbi:hypothetical protein RB623_29295 [Mesorhizobium sp. LHD-90]|uniref:hypothetical protein n=1 Tax=Mesorhizobium sp. LHD-90 TaxID=3071414 RepID=UPI0027E08388|nr:hypothetical protein [Mesorhizobium sp. LHD-90]MDQ6438169.1 hypothetical protein [Mesorhizobium sp. LHD-90]
MDRSQRHSGSAIRFDKRRVPGMSFLRRFLAEPLVQFLVIGIALFGYTAVDRSPSEADRQMIEVGPGRIAQLFGTFSLTWQRAPNPEELNGLVEAFVKEGIFYREGTKMGLDRDDTVYRRRMQQKMEFLNGTQPAIRKWTRSAMSRCATGRPENGAGLPKSAIARCGRTTRSL